MEEDVAHFKVLLEDIQRNVGVIAEAQLVANERLTRLEDGQARFDKKLDHLEIRFDVLETRFDVLETRFDGLETRFDVLETRFDVLETRFDGLETRFDGLETRFEGFAAETRDHLGRIEARLELNGARLGPKPTKRLASKSRKKS